MNNGALPFIPGENPDLPKTFKMTVFFVNGSKETYEVATWFLGPDNAIFDFCTVENEYRWIMMSNVTRIDFDKNFSKQIEIRNELARKAAEGKK